MRPQHSLCFVAALLLIAACADRATAPTSPGPARFAAMPCMMRLTADEMRARIEEVEALAADGMLSPGQAEALRHHLRNALRSLDDGNVCAAVAQLDAFDGLVRNLINAGALTPDQAAPLLIGNTEPMITIDAPVEGGLFAFGESIPFSVVVTDPEDGIVDCGRVMVTFLLGHDSHGHPQEVVSGCTGVLSTNAADVSHANNVFGIVSVSYTDLGGPEGEPPVTATEDVNIRQKRQQVEFVLDESGTDVTATNDPAGGGQHRVGLGDGDWIALNGSYDFTNIQSLGFRVASTSTAVTAGSPMAQVEIRLDGAAGPILATATLLSTGDAATWQTQTVPIAVPGGPHAIYLVFRSVPDGETGDDLFNLNWVEFGGAGIARP